MGRINNVDTKITQSMVKTLSCSVHALPLPGVIRSGIKSPRIYRSFYRIQDDFHEHEKNYSFLLTQTTMCRISPLSLFSTLCKTCNVTSYFLIGVVMG